MTGANTKLDDTKGDEVLKRMLKTPPKPNVNPPLTNEGPKKKPSDTPVKKHRSED